MSCAKSASRCCKLTPSRPCRSTRRAQAGLPSRLFTIVNRRPAVKRPLPAHWHTVRRQATIEAVSALFSRFSAMKDGAKKTGEAMFGVGALAFLLSIALFLYWSSVCPTAPDPATGHTFSLNSHGHIFYVTIAQTAVSYTLQIGGWVLLVCGLAIKQLTRTGV
jgi:hypothetical protein